MTRFYYLLACFSPFFLLLSPDVCLGQEKCGTVMYEKIRHTKNPTLESEQKFEQWMQQKINDNKIKTFQTNRTQTSTYTIPVVVHVIHNGEPVGTGINISDTQIISQIGVINNDYKRQNADASGTPTEFLAVASSIDIEFVLAKQDPEGLVTNGITRTPGTQTSWTIANNSEFKALSYWPAENYLNIWVVNLSDAYIGFAQLPESNLPGLEDSSTDRLTDGVIVDYKDFGTIDGGSFDLDPEFNKGRTATHEIGHFFGLRHIWGDDTGCATDYVADTPPQSSSTSGCPVHPQTSCGSNKMFQNYLDYTNDACMNVFTQGQVDRMVVVLGNSPRRASLLTSPGASDPMPVANDLGIRQIISPLSSMCDNPVSPVIEVRNYGNNQITSSQIQLSVDGTVVETKVFPSLLLDPLQFVSVGFNTLNFSPLSSQQVAFLITETNGTTDGKAGNNASTVQVNVPATAPLPINEPFNSLPAGWQVINPDGIITWANILAADNAPTNRAMYLDFYGYENEGSQDRLITPAFSLGNPLTSQLKFDVAYAQYPGESGDGLKIYALPGCNTELSQGILLYNKSGSELASAPSTFNPFTPTSAAQWRKSELVSLSSLIGVSSWQLAFVGNNGYGNNLYIDNAVVSDHVINDVVLMGIFSPGLVHCKSNPVIQFGVKNFSTSTVTSFRVQLTLNGGNVTTQNFSNISLNVGEQKTFSHSAVDLIVGVNQLVLSVIDPNGVPDLSPSNNTIAFNSVLDQSTDASPLRVTFDNPLEIPWRTAVPVNAKFWEPANTNKNKSLVYKAFSNTTLGDESWFVSPVLDLSRYSENSLFFDLSYAQNMLADDRLKILGSDDCGLTYNTTLFDQEGSAFRVTQLSTEWTPATNVDWRREYVNLDTLSAKKNVRLAFVVVNAHGNNLYVDNLEIFAGDDTQPPVTTLPYQLYYSDLNSNSSVAITFNLPEKKDVRLQIFTMMGQVVADNLLTDTLNQTYFFDLGIQAAGIYLFRLQIDNQVSTTKVYIGH